MVNLVHNLMENDRKTLFLFTRWFSFVVPQVITALQGDYGQDVATQAASGAEPDAPGASSEAPTLSSLSL